MEVYESIIVKVIVMLDEVEYDIIYNKNCDRYKRFFQTYIL